MPGGGGGVASRGVPLSRSSTPRRPCDRIGARSGKGHEPSSPLRETMLGKGVESGGSGPRPATAALGWGALEPAAKLATARMLDPAIASHSLGEMLGLGRVTAKL